MNNSLTFTTAETVDLPSRTLGFIARSVTVDNYSASWCYVPGANRFVPPFTYAAIVQLSSGSGNADLKWRTPAAINPATPGTGSCTVTYTDELLAPSQGVQVSSGLPNTIGVSGTVGLTGGTQVGITGQPVQVFQNPTALAVGASPATVALPTGTSAVVVWLVPHLPATSVSQIVGVQTGIIYWPPYAARGIVDPAVIPFVLYIDPSDTQLTVSYSSIAPAIAAYSVAPAINPPLTRPLPTAPLALENSPSIGSLWAGAVSAAGPIITIPANSAWYGSVWISSDAPSTSVQIQTSGAGAYPASGTPLAVVNVPSTGASGNISVPGIYVTSNNSGPVNLSAVTAGSAPSFNAGVNGILL